MSKKSVKSKAKASKVKPKAKAPAKKQAKPQGKQLKPGKLKQIKFDEAASLEIIDEQDEFLDEPDEHSDEHAEHVMKLRVGEQESDVYTEEGREEKEENDEIAPWEEGFSEGAEHGGEDALCAHCGDVLKDRDEEEVIERKYKGETMKFCSEKCAEAGPKSKGK